LLYTCFRYRGPFEGLSRALALRTPFQAPGYPHEWPFIGKAEEDSTPSYRRLKRLGRIAKEV